MKRSGSSGQVLTRLPKAPAPTADSPLDGISLHAIVATLVSWEDVQTRCQALLPHKLGVIAPVDG